MQRALILVSIFLLAAGALNCKKKRSRAEIISDQQTEDASPDSDVNQTLDPMQDLSDQEKERLQAGGIRDVATLQQSCESSPEKLKIVKHQIQFEPMSGCQYGEAPNLEPLDQSFQAVAVQSLGFEAPQDAVICEMSLKTAADAAIRYDDYLILTINERVIFASNEEIVLNLQQQGELYRWRLEDVLRQQIGYIHAPAYCISDAEDCSLPPHDNEGPLLLSISSQSIGALALAVFGEPRVLFDLIASGDDDPDDCSVSGFQLDVELSVLPLP